MTDPEPGPPDPDRFRPQQPADHPERLWTPWRMRYVGGGAREDGCVFCNRLRTADDAGSLILWRGAHAFVIMNLFPYNTGHVMLAPNDHAASPETADPAGLAEMATLLPPVLRALRRALGCDGFNVGFNVGAVAGAGIADHLHQHVVPRWTGDANFMPILASTMVLPELIPVTYAKLRAEIEREAGGRGSVALVLLSPDGARYAADSGGALPTVVAEPGRPLWRAALDRAGAGGAGIVGWAGSGTSGGEPGALALVAAGDAPTGLGWHEATAANDAAVAAAVRLLGAARPGANDR